MSLALIDAEEDGTVQPVDWYELQLSWMGRTL
jgi:hypothetical protein